MIKKSVILITMLISVLVSGVTFAADRVSLGFMYDGAEDIELVDRTNGSINQVSPTCFDIDRKGNLIITNILTHEYVQAMKERKIMVTPFLSNHWIRSKGRAAIKNAERLTNQIVNAINEYDLDGVNIDIENLTTEDKELFVEFVKMLKDKLPADKILSVSVAANPEGKDRGWQGSYDYKALGEIADYLFLMAYDEHSQGGAAGPVASTNFVENSIKYALENVSKDKIVLGIPLYGRYWKTDEEYGGEAVVIGAVPSLISKNHAIVKFDEEIGEACATFTVKADGIKSKINGVELTSGDYVIWYQTEESIKTKLKLVNEYDLLGAGVWALGQEKVEVWEYYKNELNKIPYESTKEQEIREHYEALVVDLSKLEEPNIYPLTYIKNEISYSDLYHKNIDKEEKVLNKTNVVNAMKYKKNIINRNVLDDLRRKKIGNRIFFENIGIKNIHIYRLERTN